MHNASARWRPTRDPTPIHLDPHGIHLSSGGEVLPWVRWMARFGIAAKGVVYLLIGGIALVAALYRGERPQGVGGSLDQLASVPLGDVMLIALLVGLGAFVAWKLIQAAFDPEHRATRYRVKRVLLRVGYLCSAVIHSVLIGSAAWRLFTLRGSVTDHGHAAAQWTTWVMQQPLGRWVVAALGIGIAVFGLAQIYRALTVKIGKYIGLSDGERHRLIIAIGVLGVATRGIIFVLVGALLLYAAWRFSAGTTQGLAGALDSLKQQPFGSWLLGAVALGLMAYGLFELAKARYRSI